MGSSIFHLLIYESSVEIISAFSLSPCINLAHAQARLNQASITIAVTMLTEICWAAACLWHCVIPGSCPLCDVLYSHKGRTRNLKRRAHYCDTSCCAVHKENKRPSILTIQKRHTHCAVKEQIDCACADNVIKDSRTDCEWTVNVSAVSQALISDLICAD